MTPSKSDARANVSTAFVVNTLDLQAEIAGRPSGSFDGAPGSGSLTAVPKPASMVLLTLAY